MNFKKLIRNKKTAFTLAEVVVVMAILGIMMAAFAPVVTKRTLSAGGNNKITFDVMKDHIGVYFGSIGDNKSVVIGDNKIDETADFTPKLLLIGNNAVTATEITPHIGFASKISDNALTYTGQLLMDPSLNATDPLRKGNLIVGGRYNMNYTPNSDSFYGNTIIGMNAGPDTSNVENVTAIGANSCKENVRPYSVCIGNNANLHNVEVADPNHPMISIGSSDKTYYAKDISFGMYTLEYFIEEKIANSNSSDSDIRLKNVGKEFTGGLEELNQLTFYNFTYKRDSEKTPRVGVMAQDLQKVFPNAVNENKDGYLYIRKDDMFFAALNAIKDLFTKMTDNKEKIKALEERNAMLEVQVKELQELYIDLAKKVDKKAANKKLTITPETPNEADSTPIDETQAGMPEVEAENNN